MPDVAFILKLKLDDLSSIADVAGDIEEDLIEKGYDVDSVTPWARPSLPPSGGVAFPNVPTNQQTNQQNQEPIL